MTVNEPQHRQSKPSIEWIHPGQHLRFDHGGDQPVRLVHWATGADTKSLVAPSAIVDVSTAGEQRARLNQSLLLWGAGLRLRYTSHEALGDELRIGQRDPETGLEVISVFRAAGQGVQIRHTVRKRFRGRSRASLGELRARGRPAGGARRTLGRKRMAR
ncbi:hypothetical protein ACW0JT_14990 [Arthrobacter sp. SA17]